MIRIQALRVSVSVVLLFLLSLYSQLAHAQEVPCDNSGVGSVIPADGEGEPLMPKEIQDNADIMKRLKDTRLKREAIKHCLGNNKPIINHVIDFDEYVEAWKEIKDPKRTLLIRDSVLWSFKEGRVDLRKLRYAGEVDGKITHGLIPRIQWRSVTLGPSFSAQGVELPARIYFNSSRFPDLADFIRTRFRGTASFSETTFAGEAFFYEARFSGTASFAYATFGGGAYFGQATFSGNASFRNATFCAIAYFWNATFNRRGSFGNATFDVAGFSGTTFNGDAFFDEGTFIRRAVFKRATFGGNMSLRGATVKHDLDLAGAHCAGRADFRKAEIKKLSWDSNAIPSSIKDVFDAREAKFEQAVIKEVYFSDLVDFSDTEFGSSGNNSSREETRKPDHCGHEAKEPGSEQLPHEAEKIVFENIIFEKEADFLRATFWNDAIFVRNRFRGAWDLTGVTFKEQKERASLCLSFNRISKLFMEREHLGYADNFFSILLWPPSPERSRIRGVGDKEYSCADPDEARGKNESGEKSEAEKEKTNEGLQDIYKTIELSFRETNDRWGENEAWYLGQVADQNWASWIFLDLPSRYGIDIYWVVWVSACFVLFFAIVIYLPYFLWQASADNWEVWVKLKPLQDQKRAFRFRPVEGFIENGGKEARPLRPLKDAFFLSGRAFFKLGLGTTYPRRPWLVRIAYIEWIVGMYMLIHFLFTVKNTLPIALPFLGG